MDFITTWAEPRPSNRGRTKMKLLKIKKLTGTIRVITGLHIGAGNDAVEIGGMDNPIIKNPVTTEPYIPGSSLKGKMRSLMEWKTGKVLETKGEPCNCGECEICRVFGTAAANGKDKEKALRRGPTRITLRDAHLSTESHLAAIEKDIPLVEEKNENSINRITAKANPRPMERVTPGTAFDFELLYRVIDTGDGGKMDEENFESVVLSALTLLENDFLGGGGSRGNGKIKFEGLKDETGADVSLPGA